MGCVGKLCRCLRGKLWYDDELKFRDVIYLKGATVDAEEYDDDDEDLEENRGAASWLDEACSFRCTECAEMLHTDPLQLAGRWVQLGVAHHQGKGVTMRHGDTLLYVAAVRAVRAVVATAARDGTSAGTSSRDLLTTLYCSSLASLADAWTVSLDLRRSRPFARLQSGCLLFLKLLLELCFPAVFKQAAHPPALSELAITVFSAMAGGDADSLWDAAQQLGRNRRRQLLGCWKRSISEAICVVLLLQACTCLLVDVRQPLESLGTSTEEVLQLMRRETAELAHGVPADVAWLGAWQLLLAANHLFHRTDQRLSITMDSRVRIQSWAVSVAAELALWRVGDHHSAMVGVAAVRMLILWKMSLRLSLQAPSHGPDLGTKEQQQRQQQKVQKVMQAVEEALAAASERCCHSSSGTTAQAANEARSIAMLLNDPHLPAAVELAAQRSCWLHEEASGQLAAKRPGVMPPSRATSEGMPPNAALTQLKSAGPLAHPRSLAGSPKADHGQKGSAASEMAGFDALSRLENELEGERRMKQPLVAENAAMELLLQLEVELVGSEETDPPCVTECMEIRDAKGEGDGKDEDEDDKSKVKVEAARKEDEVEKRQDLKEEVEEKKREVEEEEEGEEEEPRKEVEDAEAAETQVQASDAWIMSSRPLLEKATPEELKPSPSEHDACCEDDQPCQPTSLQTEDASANSSSSVAENAAATAGISCSTASQAGLEKKAGSYRRHRKAGRVTSFVNYFESKGGKASCPGDDAAQWL